MTAFDYIIIGAGSAGFAGAIRANELGAKTALVNAGLPLGGTCVNVGCVPSKTLLHTAEIYYQANKKKIAGVHFEGTRLNFQEVIEHELELVKEMQRKKYQNVLSELKNVTFFKGAAKFISKNEIAVGGKVLVGKKF